jgi:uncharacterized protein (TIGR00369 family)
MATPANKEQRMTATDTSRTRTYSWADPAALAAAGAGLTGLELMRKFASGELPPPPIIAMLEASVFEVEEGRVVFTLTPAEWMFNPIGSVHGGVAATLLDSCMGCAVHTVLKPDSGYTTGDLHIRYLRAMTTETGPVLAEGKVVHAGRRQATAEGRLYMQSTGKLIATGDTACVIL